MAKHSIVIIMLVAALIGMASASNYMYEKTSVKGVGYKNVELIISTQTGFNGQKLVEKESGSGNVITERTELEAERQLNRDGTPIGSRYDTEHYKLDEDRGADYAFSSEKGSITFQPGDSMYPDVIAEIVGWPISWVKNILEYDVASGDQGVSYIAASWDKTCQWSTGTNCPTDYINFTREAEFEYMPVSYQTGTYDQKWVEKLCVQNYRIGSVLTEMYTHAEHLQKATEVKTRGYGIVNLVDGKYLESCPGCCTGVLESNLNSKLIGVAHIGWISRDPSADDQLKGRHAEYGRSVEDLTGVFSVEKFIQLWGNSTCGAISVDWLPCV